MTEVKILNAQGARAMGKPEGTYLTLEADELQTPDEDCHSRVVDELAMQLNELMKRAGCQTHFEYTLYIHLENLTVCHSHYTDRTSSHARTCVGRPEQFPRHQFLKDIPVSEHILTDHLHAAAQDDPYLSGRLAF